MKHFLILGLGKSGLASLKLLEKEGVVYVIEENKTHIKNINYIDLEYLNKNLPLFDLVVVSPGFDKNTETYKMATILGKEVISEIELGYRYLKNKNAKIIGVTGSNGKTTIVTVIHNLLNSINIKNYLLGNIGTPLCEEVEKINDNSIVILELSSFQLENIKDFKADVNVISNITPNHLDHVISYPYYIASKKRLLLNNKVVIADDLYFKDMKIKSIRNEIIKLQNDTIYYKDKIILTKKDLSNYPSFFMKDVAFALLATYQLVGFHQIFIEVIKNFKNLKYREEITIINNIKIMNDSKSTSVGALKEALKNFLECTRYIIVGGIYKSEGIENIPFSDKDKIYVYGKDKDILSKLLTNCHAYDSLKEVVINISKNIEKDAAIIFSPSCSSFDQFENYLKRGEYFDALIKEYIEDAK